MRGGVFLAVLLIVIGLYLAVMGNMGRARAVIEAFK